MINKNNFPLSTLKSQLSNSGGFQIVCLSGQMAAGKNFVAALLEKELGFASIDLDVVVHRAIEICTPEIFGAFAEEASEAGIVLSNADGSLNRRALGSLIFPRPELLARQEGIVYPKVIEITKQYIEENKAKNTPVLINATVLYKTPELLELCDRIFFVKACTIKRFFRARKRDGMAFAQILQRFRSQKGLLKKYRESGKEIVIIRN
ncbi:MAG: dephospho-CoA kinase [Treponema sp.]|nr:dephospho-CoA kinase [Candidatus Treponema equifaecale]